MHTSLEGHKTKAPYGSRASPSDSTFHLQTTKQNLHGATVETSTKPEYIYPLDETARSVTQLAMGWRVGSVRDLSPCADRIRGLLGLERNGCQRLKGRRLQLSTYDPLAPGKFM